MPICTIFQIPYPLCFNTEQAVILQKVVDSAFHKCRGFFCSVDLYQLAPSIFLVSLPREYRYSTQ